MKFLRIFLFTLIWAFLGFIVGYILFARWGNEFIPLKNIFASNRVEDAVLNGWLNVKLKVCGTAGGFAFAGFICILFIEFRGGTKKGTLAKGTGFYECKYCGFKSQVQTAFCEACERDDNGLTREDYKKKAEEKVKSV